MVPSRMNNSKILLEKVNEFNALVWILCFIPPLRDLFSLVTYNRFQVDCYPTSGAGFSEIRIDYWGLMATLVGVFFFLTLSPVSSASPTYGVVMYLLNYEKSREFRESFSPGEKIFVEFSFLPRARQTYVEFRWINPMNKKEQAHFEWVESPEPFKSQKVVCWLFLGESIFEKIAGSKFFGQWRLEVWVDNRHVATKAFSVGN